MCNYTIVLPPFYVALFYKFNDAVNTYWFPCNYINKDICRMHIFKC